MLIDQLVSTLAPHSCVQCGSLGKLLCRRCLPTAVKHKRPSCFLCNRQTRGWRVCTACHRKSRVEGVVVAARYEGAIKQLVKGLKYDRKAATASVLATLLAGQVPDDSFDVITAIPTSSRRIRQRGYNHARLIARALSKQTAIPFHELLGRIGHGSQVGTSRKQRLAQMAGQMYPRKHRFIEGKRILVVDDVVTTGATINEAARTLKQAGAKTVWGAAVAKH